jgi:hypothetical protein
LLSRISGEDAIWLASFAEARTGAEVVVSLTLPPTFIQFRFGSGGWVCPVGWVERLSLRSGRHHFSEQILQRSVVKHRIGDQPLQAGVFVFQQLQPLGLRNVHADVFGFPLGNVGVAHAVFAEQLGDGNPGLLFLHDHDDLFFAETVALHSLVFNLGQT